MTTKKKAETKAEPIAANAGPTAFVTDPETGATEPVEPPSKAAAKSGDYSPAEGAAARMATMTPTKREGVGQVETVSGKK